MSLHFDSSSCARDELLLIGALPACLPACLVSVQTHCLIPVTSSSSPCCCFWFLRHKLDELQILYLVDYDRMPQTVTSPRRLPSSASETRGKCLAILTGPVVLVGAVFA